MTCQCPNHFNYKLEEQSLYDLDKLRIRTDINWDAHVGYPDYPSFRFLRPEPLESLTNRIRKRAFDVIFSLLMIFMILSWLIPILAFLIKITSRGPIFFRQRRSGKNNRQFTCFKLRTLTVNNEANTRQVTVNDARITKWGRLLRKTNLDELPQFFNVLIGNMSVIGPRPHMLEHTRIYSRVRNEYMIRHLIKPGITGWAQVSGYRGEIKDEDQLRKRIDHDIWYMKNWSLRLDLKITWMTLLLTLRGDKNAY